MTTYSLLSLLLGFFAYALAYYVSDRQAMSGWLFSSVVGIFCVLFVFPGHFKVPGVEALHDWGAPVVKGAFAASWAVGIAVASSIFHGVVQSKTQEDSLS
ncbi:hypothetical protein [Parvibium lacunae]|uniref:Uncharacterized protein n=1 Tax=Parvibium lacunae TaxID=1888893 RepID=A0A368L8R2_9BURK|nr:hypothetical protein [Parvibium lacunae]RCS59619.1 hypothetical protein DU000_02575 [Parvibium lacunae]